jgi:hypothetical protein
MQKICQNHRLGGASCQKEFTIEEEDLNFYQKIKVPSPSFCPDCRLARKLSWRNENSLYRRTCDLCKKNIISMYKPDTAFPVYCNECFNSDKWDPAEYGVDYNFEKTFFEQFNLLQKNVPRRSAYGAQNINSDYCNYTAHLKNCYLLFGSWFSENCNYGQTIMESKDCTDCLFIKNCELCFSSIDCQKSSLLFFSQNCLNCIDSAFLYDCKNCQNCLFSYNLRNKNYYVFNKPVSKEEFVKIKKEILSSYSQIKKSFESFRKEIQEKAIHRYMTGEKNYDVSGEFIYGSKNVHESYYINDGENEKFAVRGGKGQKDAMDVFGVHAGELAYECNNIDFSSRCLFSMNGEGNVDTNYLLDCDHLNNSFGCISMRKKEYCILNKQYSKESFDNLKSKIVEQMNEMPYIDKKGRVYKYGEFFPIELSPHSYNETLAQEYFPLDENTAKNLGYTWDTMEDKNYMPTLTYKDLPDNIDEVTENILSEIILCQAWDEDKEKAKNHKCTKAYKVTRDELTMYRKLNIPLPRKCPNTRIYENSRLRNLPKFFDRTCMCEIKNHHHGTNKCEVKFKTSYSPDRPEIIYCEHCYQQEVY